MLKPSESIDNAKVGTSVKASWSDKDNCRNPNHRLRYWASISKLRKMYSVWEIFYRWLEKPTRPPSTIAKDYNDSTFMHSGIWDDIYVVMIKQPELGNERGRLLGSLTQTHTEHFKKNYLSLLGPFLSYKLLQYLLALHGLNKVSFITWRSMQILGCTSNWLLIKVNHSGLKLSKKLKIIKIFKWFNVSHYLIKFCNQRLITSLIRVLNLSLTKK